MECSVRANLDVREKPPEKNSLRTENLEREKKGVCSEEDVTISGEKRRRTDREDTGTLTSHFNEKGNLVVVRDEFVKMK